MSTGLLLVMAASAVGLAVLNWGTPWFPVWYFTAALYGSLAYALY